ncbi:MAG: hypothetical protein IJO48_06415 [Clostridia bacterium]|nr:hypothetical protein [Clostridia bacterium]
MKKLLILTISVVLALSFIACGLKDEEKSNDNEQYNGVVLNSGGLMAEIIGKTLNDAVNPYKLVYKIDQDGVELTVTQGVKDGMVYMEFEYQGTVIKNLKDTVTGYHYAIYDSEKLIFKSTTSQTKIEPFDNNHEQLNKSFTEGNEEINGVSYKYEKAEGDGGTLTLYFDESDKLCYMKSDDTLMEIIEYNNYPDETWFEIRDDYTLMEN